MAAGWSSLGYLDPEHPLQQAIRTEVVAQTGDGDPAHVAEVTDVWTFAREVNSRDPNWRLVATESVE